MLYQNIISEIIMWQNSNLKIRHKTLFKEYKNGNLKNVDTVKKLQVANVHG